MSGLPEERLQQGNREVSEHEGGVLVGSQQAAPQQQLGILSSKGNLLQLQPFIAVAAAYCYHLQQSPHAASDACRASCSFPHIKELTMRFQVSSKSETSCMNMQQTKSSTAVTFMIWLHEISTVCIASHIFLVVTMRGLSQNVVHA